MLVILAFITSEGEPVCEGPLILGVDDSDPPQCSGPIEGLPSLMPLIVAVGAALALAVIAASGTVQRLRRARLNGTTSALDNAGSK